MLVDDNFREVLINCDITTIKQMVHVNKNIKSYCNNSTFWKTKFIHDNILMMIDNLNTFDEWVDEYESILQCKNDCINILLINKIESQIDKRSTPINIFYRFDAESYGVSDDDSDKEDDNSDKEDDSDDDESKRYIPYYMIEKVDINRIQIEFVSDNKYIFWYYNDRKKYSVDGLYVEALNILTKMMYYSFQDKNIKITDDIEFKRYIFIKPIKYDDTVSMQRQTIYDTLKVLNLLSGH